jgi:hypothetical protein
VQSLPEAIHALSPVARQVESRISLEGDVEKLKVEDA